MQPLNDAIDIPDKRDYPANLIDERAEGEPKKRPKAKVIIRNQGKVPGCTRYSVVQINNGQNILEYEATNEEYQQIDPLVVWNRGDQVKSIQAGFNQLKKEGYISGYVRCEKTPEAIRKYLDMGCFIGTGSNNGERTQTRKTGVYTVRTDGKIVGHAWSITEDNKANSQFICANSRGPTRGDKGYFRLKYTDLDKIYNCYAIIDLTRKAVFDKVAEKETAKEVVRQLRKLYGFGNAEIQKWLEIKQIGGYLKNYYNFTDNDI